MSKQYVDPKTDVLAIDAAAAFAGLTDKEKMYSYYLYAASNLAAPIIARQRSTESFDIIKMFYLFLQERLITGATTKATTTTTTKAAAESTIEDQLATLNQLPVELLAYISQLFTSHSNYVAFGDAKFTPQLSEAEVEACLSQSTIWQSQLQPLWLKVKQAMFSYEAQDRQIGCYPDGRNNYYSADMTKAEVEAIHLGPMSPYNTRVFRVGKNTAVYVASVDSGRGGLSIPICLAEDGTVTTVNDGKVRPTFIYGDHSHYLKLAVDNLKLAANYASNETEVAMLQAYAEAFQTGDTEAHVAGSKLWVQNKSPAVESYIGFIESYADPCGQRGEWEGFVAVVDKATSAKYARLVAAAPAFIAQLPWDKRYEKDTFSCPDFTALEVVTMATSSLPAGINIPNYDDVRQNFGFKNVSLINVTRAYYNISKVKYVAEADLALYRQHQAAAFDVQVALHELLGHGTGKLLPEAYPESTTFNSVFGRLASAYEECRAEAVGIYLSVLPEVLTVFGYSASSQDGLDALDGLANQADLIYINWLSMARAGLASLQYYTDGVWRQAHCQARYVILRVLLEAGVAHIHYNCDGSDSGNSNDGDSGNSNQLYVTVDRQLIASRGVEAVGRLLTHLQTYKSTADYTAAKAYFDGYSAVEGDFVNYHQYILKHQTARPIWVQPSLHLQPPVATSNTTTSNATNATTSNVTNTVEYKSYPSSFAGLILSFLQRFPSYSYNYGY